MRFEIYKQEDQGEKCWHWRLVNEEEETVTCSKEPSYKGAIVASVKRIREEGQIAVVREGEEPEGGIEVLEKICTEIDEIKITWENPEDDPAHQEKHDDRTETKGIPGSMGIDQIRQELAAGLNDIFEWEVDYVNSLDELLLFILDYSPRSNDPPVSFVLSLRSYDEKQFPPKCWMTCAEVKEIKLNGSTPTGPRPHEPYGRFSYGGKQFHPYSVDLSGYMANDVSSIKEIVEGLYNHVKIGPL